MLDQGANVESTRHRSKCALSFPFSHAVTSCVGKLSYGDERECGGGEPPSTASNVSIDFESAQLVCKANLGLRKACSSSFSISSSSLCSSSVLELSLIGASSPGSFIVIARSRVYSGAIMWGKE